VDRDEELRIACFLALDTLRAQRGDDLPYEGALAQGFAFGSRRIPFFNFQKGIYRAAAQRGPAALSLQTSWKSPYDDEQDSHGFLYAYRAGDMDQPDNRSLRAAYELQVPVAYFVGVRPGWYQAVYPVFVAADNSHERRVRLTVGDLDQAGPMPEIVRPDDPIERRYLLRTTRTRLHQGRFRGLVLPAYRDQCAICRLKEMRLLDASHIVPDPEPEGVASVSNGLSLCSIHHRAFDQNLVGVSPDYRVYVSRRLLEDDDGPMLELLKEFHGASIVLPARPDRRPDRERLAIRFEMFRRE
jgi:putative restriction endonuclease